MALHVDERWTTSFVAGEAMDGSAGYGVKQDSGVAWGVDLCDAQGEDGLGVLKFEEETSGNPVTVVMEGFVEAVAGAAIAIGAYVTVGAAGKFETAATGDYVWGRAMTATSADGDPLVILLTLSKYVSA